MYHLKTGSVPWKFLKLEKDLVYSQNACSNEQGVFDLPIGSPVVYFFHAGELLASKNTKLWPILAHTNHFLLFRRKFTHFLVYFLGA